MAFGFKAYRGDGSTMIDTTDGVARVVYAADFGKDFTGTVSVPAFDSDRGYYTFRMYPFLYYANFSSSLGGEILPEDHGYTTHGSGEGRAYITICPRRVPTVSWDNVSKVLSITANSQSQDLTMQTARYRYRIFMVHYK